MEGRVNPTETSRREISRRSLTVFFSCGAYKCTCTEGEVMPRVVVAEIGGYHGVIKNDILRPVALFGICGGAGGSEAGESRRQTLVYAHASASRYSEQLSSYISRASV